MKWYKYDIKNLSYDEYSKWYSLMSEKKQRRVDSFRFETDKKLTVVGDMLARKAISDLCSVSFDSIVLKTGEHGKPYVEDLSVHFNISHSGDMVVCAVDDKPVGIDIESIRKVNLRVAKRVCTNEELVSVFGDIPEKDDFYDVSDPDVLKRFFELWTAKEACAKCSGIGIAGIKAAVDMSRVERFCFDDYIVSIYR